MLAVSGDRKRIPSELKTREQNVLKCDTFIIILTNYVILIMALSLKRSLRAPTAPMASLLPWIVPFLTFTFFILSLLKSPNLDVNNAFQNRKIGKYEKLSKKLRIAIVFNDDPENKWKSSFVNPLGIWRWRTPFITVQWDNDRSWFIDSIEVLIK